MASVAVWMAMVVISMGGIVLEGVEAQGTVTCNSGPFLQPAPFADATALVETLRNNPENAEFCMPSQLAPGANANDNCWVVLIPDVTGNAAVVGCAQPSYCISNNLLGNYLNEVLAQCNDLNNEVQGVFELSPGITFSLNSCSSVHPGGSQC